MMRMSIAMLVFCLLSMATSGALAAESLNIIDSIQLSTVNAPFIDPTEAPVYFSGCYVSGDTILVASDAGLLIKYPDDKHWTELINFNNDSMNASVLYAELRFGRGICKTNIYSHIDLAKR